MGYNINVYFLMYSILKKAQCQIEFVNVPVYCPLDKSVRYLDDVVVHAVPLSAEGILTVTAFHIFAIRYQMNLATATTSS